MGATDQDFFDNLLSGLEASVFDADPFSSPVKPSQGSQYQRVPAVPLSTKAVNTFSTPKKKPAKYVKVDSHQKKPPSIANAAKDKENIAELLEGIDDWDDSAIDILKSPPTKILGASVAPPPTSQPLRLPISKQYLRFSIDHVQEGAHPASGQLCKIAQVSPDGPSTSRATGRTLYLQDDWFEVPLKQNDIVHIIGDTTTQGDIHLCLSNQDQLLIHHPDTLITATAVSTSMPCARKPLLQDRLRSTSPITEPLLYGNLLHELFQSCLINGKWSDDFRQQEALRLCSQESTITAAWQLNKPKTELIDQLIERSASWQVWSSNYLGAAPKIAGILSDPRGKGVEQSGKVCLSKVHDIEEDIWSPRLGMKGKLDASVQARVVGKTATPAERSPAGTVAPFEIKTGRTIGVMEHRAQTMLYTLLMADRYDTEVGAGLLFYTYQDQLIRVSQSKNELRGLVQARNELARYASMRSDLSLARAKGLRDELDEDASIEPQSDVLSSGIEDGLLPEPIDDAHWCKRCYAVDACMLYRKAIDAKPHNSSTPSEDIVNLYESKTSHLSKQHTEFFSEWEHLINLEEREAARNRKEIWTMTAEERQQAGRCLADMIIDLSFSLEDTTTTTSTGSMVRYTYRFLRSSLATSTSSQQAYNNSRSLLGGLLAVGDPVVVSLSSPEILALARGFVLEVKPQSILLGVDHQLDNLTGSKQEDRSAPAEQTFRIDKDELASGMGRVRDNLAQLFYAEGDHKRKQLIVDLFPPIFSQLPSDYASAEEQSLNLNIDQRGAIDKVLSAQDYALILGMPGTGKTTTVAEIITALVRRGKSVLLTSYTHSAVDNILLKLKDKDVDMLRLGSTEKILPALHAYTLSEGGPITTVNDLEHRFMSPKVVATTALSINHPIFMRRHFDYCIVDEASQITLPACLGPLRFADRFVLVGDHNQLPPLVRNYTARRSGLETSLFKRLCEARPEAVVYLSYQYRMNKDIMALPNRLVYNGLMKGGSEDVLGRTLDLEASEPTLCALHTRCACHGQCWAQQLMEPSRSVIFMNTDNMDAKETKEGHLIVNNAEGALVSQAVRMLLSAGLPADQLGVITPYRQQIKLLSSLLEDFPAIEILTADRSQGRDKECIVMSLTRSNDERKVGDLLRDWRRLNVCLTRARSKLVLFGSRSTLSEELSSIFSVFEERDMFFDLPRNALEQHVIPSSNKRRFNHCSSTSASF